MEINLNVAGHGRCLLIEEDPAQARALVELETGARVWVPLADCSVVELQRDPIPTTLSIPPLHMVKASAADAIAMRDELRKNLFPVMLAKLEGAEEIIAECNSQFDVVFLDELRQLITVAKAAQ